MGTVFRALPREEFPYLGNTVYADWTGAALPPVSLIEKHTRFLREYLLGNPHSHHGPSERAMEEIEHARGAVLRYMNASPDEYDVIFTPNASSAILLLRHFRFENGEYLYTTDNHNSVVGLREIAREKGTVIRTAPLLPNLEFDSEALRRLLRNPTKKGYRLFAFPAKSNYSGKKHPFDWILDAHKNGWLVLLDAAAFLANDELNLGRVKPDFISVSFYKMFGFPTGIGCLLVRRPAYAALKKPYFSGGTVEFSTVEQDAFVLKARYAGYEDGTPNFQMLSAVARGLSFLEELGGRKTHANALGAALYDALSGESFEGKTIVLHSPRCADIVTWSVRKDDGRIIPVESAEMAAREAGIALRTGCFCNPGVNETIFGYQDPSKGKPIGAIRASFGYANTPADVERVAEFMRNYLRTL